MVNYSQTDEQKRLIKLFEIIGIKFNKSLEFGAGDGKTYSNTKHFIEQLGFVGIMWDIHPRNKMVNKEIVTAENINELYEKYGLTEGCDLISIDVDGNDYWIWKALKYKPRIVIIEYNGGLEKDKSVTIEYDPNFIHTLTNYYGASWKALEKLGKEKGYKLVDSTPLNMIFILESEIVSDIVYGRLDYDVKRSWPNDNTNKKWMEV